jgi:hypothetical protein
MNCGKSTDELFKDAKKGILPSKDEQIPSLATYLVALFAKYNFKCTKIADATGISQSQLYTFINEKNPVLPNRNQLLSIMFVIGATLEETQDALKYAAFRGLYPRDPRDSVIIRYLSDSNHNRGIALVNEALENAGYAILP